MNTKDSKHSNSADDALFRESVGDAQPLATRRRHRPEARVAGKALSRRQDEQRVLQESLAEPPDSADIETGEELVFQRPSVSRRTMRELRRGKLAVQDEIDLHGLTSAEARLELLDFINACATRGLRCVRVVHGKGLRSGHRGPVLKFAVNKWLRHWEPVLAFCTARTADGGSGAIYVLLTPH